MTTFARARITDEELPIVECIYNRELMVPVKTDQLFFVMSEEVNRKFDIDSKWGEMLIYSPQFEQELTCMWVAHQGDFDLLELEGAIA